MAGRWEKAPSKAGSRGTKYQKCLSRDFLRRPKQSGSQSRVRNLPYGKRKRHARGSNGFLEIKHIIFSGFLEAGS